MFVLRDYQQKAIDFLRESFKRKRSALLRLDTGAGKTVVFSYISESCNRTNRNVIILVHRKELVRQTSMALARYETEHWLYCDRGSFRAAQMAHIERYGKTFLSSHSNIVVAMVQSSKKFEHLIEGCDLLICDEAHHFAAKNYVNLANKLPKKAKILGVTATPQRTDGKGLGEYFQELIEVISMNELIQRGYLCTPRVFQPPQKFDLSNLHSRFGDYIDKELADELDKPHIIGDAIEHYRKICDGVPALAYCINVSHAEHVAAQFKSAGYRAIAINGSTDGAIRDDALNGLTTGKWQVVCSCDIISEGTDIPLAACAILLRPTKSIVLFMQQCGRVLRTYPDEKIMQEPNMQSLIKDDVHYAFILDHANNTARFGLPHQTREWSLEGGKMDKEKVKAVATCPECFNVHYPAKNCPYCGFDYSKKHDNKPIDSKIKQIDGELVEVVLSFDNPESIKSKPYKEVMDKASGIDDWLAIADAKGYKKSWVINQIKSRAEIYSEKTGKPFEDLFRHGLEKMAHSCGYKKSWVDKMIEVRS